MLAGKLDRLITIETPTTTKDAAGGLVHAWATLAQVWAQKLDLRGREFIEAGQVQAGAEAKFRIRWRSDFDTSARIVYGNVNYEILHLAEIGRREGLEILVKRP